MKEKMILANIPAEEYSQYRYETIFGAYKWDPQVNDSNTISNYVILLDKQVAQELDDLAEQLAKETVQIEEAILNNLNLAKELGLPKKIIRTLPKLKNYDSKNNVRLMRFDFHPTIEGFKVSEVNSDVPGGLAEASLLPKIARKYFPGYNAHKDIIESIYEAFKLKLRPEDKKIAFVYATSYSDDRQVMQYVSDYFKQKGFQTIMIAPDHIKWKAQKAFCLLYEEEGEIDGIIRFFPLEWLVNLPRKSKWQGYYHTITPSCNHPISIFAQSKRLPLVWDKLNIDLQAWRKLLPITKDPKDIIKAPEDNYIYKPALGRVGELISINENITKKELQFIEKSVKNNPKNWIMQQMFKSDPLITLNDEIYHLCIGVFTVDGKSAGFYGRISPYPKIDSNAIDIPILVKED